MRFTKMHGAGNDYVYVNCFDQPLPKDAPEVARQISHRRFGVGGDGLILIRPSEIADARMQMFNTDGSEAEMCGNGIRCVAKYVYDHGICRRGTLRIETGRGVLMLEVETANGRVERVRRGQQLHVGPDLDVGSDRHRRRVERDQPEVDERPRPDGDLGAVVAAQRREEDGARAQ